MAGAGTVSTAEEAEEFQVPTLQTGYGASRLLLSSPASARQTSHHTVRVHPTRFSCRPGMEHLVFFSPALQVQGRQVITMCVSIPPASPADRAHAHAHTHTYTQPMRSVKLQNYMFINLHKKINDYLNRLNRSKQLGKKKKICDPTSRNESHGYFLPPEMSRMDTSYLPK